MEKEKDLNLNLDLDLNDMIEKNMTEAWEATRELRESENSEWADETPDDK